MSSEVCEDELIIHYIDNVRSSVQTVVDFLVTLYVSNAPVRIILWVKEARRWVFSKTVANRFVEMQIVSESNDDELTARLKVLYSYGGVSIKCDAHLDPRVVSVLAGYRGCVVLADAKCARSLDPCAIAANKRALFVDRWLRERSSPREPCTTEWQKHYHLALAYPKHVTVLSPPYREVPRHLEKEAVLRDVLTHMPGSIKSYTDTCARAIVGRTPCARCGKHPIVHLLSAYVTGGEFGHGDIPEDAKRRADYVFVLNANREVDACSVYARLAHGDLLLTLLEITIRRMKTAPNAYALYVREALRIPGALLPGTYRTVSGETVEILQAQM